jgi:hypothetical protein
MTVINITALIFRSSNGSQASSPLRAAATVLAICAVAATVQAAPLSITDVSPDRPFASFSQPPSDGNVYETGGRIYDIVIDPGNPNILYASANGSGIWKSTSAGTDWFWSSSGLLTGRTQGGPTASLAIDSTHLAADGSAQRLLYATQDEDARANSGNGGLWISLDAAGSWTHAALPSCGTGVQSVLFAGGEAFVATNCGVFTNNNADLSGTWTAMALPPGFSSSSSVGLAAWGNTLFACQIPSGTALTMVARSLNLGQANSWSRGQDLPYAQCQSLAAGPPIDNAHPSSVVMAAVLVDLSGNQIGSDVFVYSSFGNQPSNPQSLAFNKYTTTYSPPHSCAPTGSGSYRVYVALRPSAPVQNESNVDIYASDNGCFYEYDVSGPSPTWHRLNELTCDQVTTSSACIHDDSWGMAFPSTYDPDNGSCRAYVATDGGVYVNAGNNNSPCIGWQGLWLTANHGLHAMNNYKMTGVHQDQTTCGVGVPCAALYTATADNGAWVSRPPAGGTLGTGWAPLGCCGDAGLTLLDPLAPNGLVAARGSTFAYYYNSSAGVPPVITDFLKDLTPSNFVIGIDPPEYGSFSQVMALLNDPCPGCWVKNGGDFFAVTANRTASSASPDQIQRNTGTGWRPIDTSGFFSDTCASEPSNAPQYCDIAEIATAGGHLATTVYVLSSNFVANPPNQPPKFSINKVAPGQVWRGSVKGGAATGTIAGWNPASGRFSLVCTSSGGKGKGSGTPSGGSPITTCQTVDQTLHQAANLFVNAYNANVLYATDVSSQPASIKSSFDGGKTWNTEQVLSQVATNYGEFAFRCGIPDFSTGDVNFAANQCALSDMFFNVHDPKIMVAALYPGGVAFTRDGGGTWIPLYAGNQPILDDLPGSSHPGGLPSSVFYDDHDSKKTGRASLYVALANRGIVRIDGPFPTLSAIEWQFPPGIPIATLCPSCLAIAGGTQSRLPPQSVKVLDETTGQSFALRRDSNGIFRGTELVDTAKTPQVSYRVEFDGIRSPTFSHKLNKPEQNGGIFLADCQVWGRSVSGGSTTERTAAARQSDRCRTRD